MVKAVIKEEVSTGVKARSALWYLTFFGFAINYIVRINASIAIVDMIDVNYKKVSAANRTILTSECLVEINSTTPEVVNGFSNITENLKYVSLERRLLDFLGVSQVFSSSTFHHHMTFRSSMNETVSSGMSMNSL